MNQKLTYFILTLINFTLIYANSNPDNDSENPKIDYQIFIENKGQWPENVLFLSKQGCVFYWILTDGLVIDIGKAKQHLKKFSFPDEAADDYLSPAFERHVVKLKFLYGRTKTYKTLEEGNVSFNFFKGNDPSKHVSGVKSYKLIVLENLYPGIDLRYNFTEKGNLRFDFIVHPGADPSQILFSLEGQEKLDVSAQDIFIQTRLGNIQISDLALVQKNDTFQASFNMQNEIIGVKIPEYDKNETLIIDPTLYFSSFLGGSGDDYIHAFDKKTITWPLFYFGGATRSADFPFATGYDQSFNGGNFDAFVAYIYYHPLQNTCTVTYLGGNGNDYCRDIKVYEVYYFPDKILVSGVTYSSDFPTTAGAFQTVRPSTYYADGFISCFNISLGNLIFSTFFGGNHDDNINGLDVDNNGYIYIAGNTKSSNFPITQNAYQTTYASTQAGFVSKLKPSGDSLVFSTYLQGSDVQDITSLSLNDTKPIVVGFTNSSNFPVTSGSFQTTPSDYDIFVTRFNITGSNIERSARFGGNIYDYATDLDVDYYGQPYICGKTGSFQGFPFTSNAIQHIFRGGGYDGFFVKLDSSFSNLLYSTYFGGSGAEEVYMIHREPFTKNVSIVGKTGSANFPVTPNAFQPHIAGSVDGFILKINPEGEIVKHYGTFIGNNVYDEITGITSIYIFSDYWFTREYVFGHTTSHNFYLQNPLQGSRAGYFDGFLMEMSLPTALAVDFVPDIACVGDTAIIVVRGTEYVAWNNNLPSDTMVSVIVQPGQNYTVRGSLNGDTTVLQFTYPVELINVTTNPSNTNLCYGQSVTLSASGASSYQWLPLSLTGQQINISPDSSITLYVVGTSTHGCKDTAQVNIVVNYPPAYELVSSPATDHQMICLGDSIQKIEYLLHHINAVSYQPNSFPAGVNASFNISTNKLTIQGKPYMTGTFVYGVEGSGYCGSLFFNGLIQVNQCTGIENYSSENDSKIILTNQYVYLDIDEPMTLYITDAQGKRVKNYEVDASSKIIDISDLARGIYFFNFQNGKNVTLRMMVIKS